MLFDNVMIESLGYILAPHRVTSSDIEEQISETLARLNLSPNILEILSGIRERRLWDPGVMPSEVATIAAQKAIEFAGIDLQQIGCLISTSVTKDYIEPSVASLVHGNLNLSPECINYDVTNACLGFLNGMCNVGMMIEKGLIKYGLVVAGESARRLVESTIKKLQQPDVTQSVLLENIATLTLGSGAVAMVLSHKDVSKAGHKINGAISLAATQHNRLCLAEPDGMKSNPGRMLAAANKLSIKAWKVASQTFERWSDNTIDHYIPHQVSMRNTKTGITTLGVTPSKVKTTFSTLGNTGPVGLPTALALAKEEGEIQAGHHVALVGMGSGLNSMMMSVDW